MSLTAAKMAGILDCSAAEIAASWPDQEFAQKHCPSDAGDVLVEVYMRRIIERVCAKTYDMSMGRGRWNHIVGQAVRRGYYGAWVGATLRKIHGSDYAEAMLEHLPISLRPSVCKTIWRAGMLALSVDGREWLVPSDLEAN